MNRLFTFLILSTLISCSSQKEVLIDVKDTYIIDKYAQLLEVPKAEITNVKLYKFIDSWYGTKYKYGGLTKEGVDCSGFCNLLYKDIYGIQLKRRAADIAKAIKKISKKKLKEGDLIFFTISSKKNSHVGIYLKNNKFVHASTSKGVMISSLENPYYIKTYNKGGRLK